MAGVFHDLGRPELEDAARLGVSELVTNALLHGEPPITVQVRGIVDHPRVEVSDASPEPPQAAEGLTIEDDELSTVGRGLSIVSLNAAAWGIEIDDDGKVVWFEPAVFAPDSLQGPVDGHVLDARRRRDLVPKPAGELVPVHLIDMPVQVFADYRRHYRQLQRELRLLSLAYSDDYPVAAEFTAVIDQVEAERRYARGIDALDEAIEADLERVDLHYLVPASAPRTMEQLLDLAELADDFCQAQRLLALASTPQQAALRRWYLGEFARQGAGRAPQPWTGSFAVEHPAHCS